jgi:hypothetical protein
MNGIGSSLTPRVPHFSTNWDGLIIWSEMLCRFYESKKSLPRLNNKWIHVDPSLMGGIMRFFKPKHIGKNYRWGIRSLKWN